VYDASVSGRAIYAYVGNDPLNRIDPNGLVMERTASGAINLTQRAIEPYVAAYQNFIVQPLATIAGAALNACGAACDPGVQASVAPAFGPLGVALEGSSVAFSGLRAFSRLGQAFEVGGPTLPSMEAAGGKTLGLLRTSVGDTTLISGFEGPASAVPTGSAGFDIVTRAHVEGHAAAAMRQQGVAQGTLYLNNPTICPNCVRNLPSMLPSGSNLNVVLPNGTVVPFTGAP
jgi:hypothetical protein